MKLYLNCVYVCGYDELGNLWYAKEVSGDQMMIADVFKEAFAIDEVIKVTIELSDDNWRVYNENGKEVQK